MAYRTVVLADNPASYWRHGEPSGTTAADEQSANAGTYIGSPTLGQTGALAGDANTSVLFSAASGQYVNVGAGASLDLGDGPLSLEAWVNLTDTSNYRAIISHGSGAYYLRTGLNQVEFLRAGVALIANSGASVLTAGTWYHVVATKSGASIHLYINGVDVTANVSNSTFVNGTPDTTIGADGHGSSERFNGLLDEVAIYNTVLSPTRVLAHYNEGINPTVVVTATGGRGGRVMVRRRSPENDDDIALAKLLEATPWII